MLSVLIQEHFLKNIYLFLFLAALGLRCCVLAFSSCGKWRLLFVVVCGLLVEVASLVAEHRLWAHRLQQLWFAGSRVQAQQLWHTGLVAPWHVGSSQSRARIRVPCIGRQILNHCATREVQELFLQFCVFFTSGREPEEPVDLPITKNQRGTYASPSCRPLPGEAVLALQGAPVRPDQRCSDGFP